MKKGLFLLPMFLLLTGCEMLPFARELESTMLVQVLGVDWTQGEITLTGASDPGAGGGAANVSVISASGTTLEQAKTALKGVGEEYVSLTHVTQLILGAETDLATVLKAALEEPALGQSATVWFSEKGSAQVLMDGADGGAKRLSSIELNGNVQPITVLQSMMQLKERGWVELPVLQNKGKTLVPAGTRMVWGAEDEK